MNTGWSILLVVTPLILYTCFSLWCITTSDLGEIKLNVKGVYYTGLGTRMRACIVLSVLILTFYFRGDLHTQVSPIPAELLLIIGCITIFVYCAFTYTIELHPDSVSLGVPRIWMRRILIADLSDVDCIKGRLVFTTKEGRVIQGQPFVVRVKEFAELVRARLS